LRATKGRIVNIGSIQSFVHVRTPSSPAYTASSTACSASPGARRRTRQGRRARQRDRPGFIETPLNERSRASNPDLAKMFIGSHPAGRAGKPEDIVGPAIFLASDLSAYVTGSIVMVDGGYRGSVKSLRRWRLAKPRPRALPRLLGLDLAVARRGDWSAARPAGVVRCRRLRKPRG
jgi:NAD(P)-dependent dehydrogenase (short-subunit alcohol dehydrogenase family)